MYMNHKEVVHVVLKRILFVSLISQEIMESFPMAKSAGQAVSNSMPTTRQQEQGTLCQ